MGYILPETHLSMHSSLLLTAHCKKRFHYPVVTVTCVSCSRCNGWRNKACQATSSMQLHLHPNAAANQKQCAWDIKSRIRDVWIRQPPQGLTNPICQRRVSLQKSLRYSMKVEMIKNASMHAWQAPPRMHCLSSDLQSVTGLGTLALQTSIYRPQVRVQNIWQFNHEMFSEIVSAVVEH